MSFHLSTFMMLFYDVYDIYIELLIVYQLIKCR